jgi:hypothetical protein
VNWATNTIDYDQPEIGQTITYTVNGTVTGYQDADGVDAQFQLIVTNEYADPVLARIAIMGDARIEVPTGNQITRTYTATLIDTNGNPMTGPTITWSLAGSVPGVSINSGSGELTVTNAAGNKNCEVVASAGGVNQHYSVKIAKVDPAHSSVSIVIERDPGSSRNWITTYSLVACDDLGTGITNLTETDIYVNRVYDNSSTYKKLTEYSTRKNWSNQGNGLYSWSITSGRNWTIDDIGLRIQYGSSQMQIGIENLNDGRNTGH